MPERRTRCGFRRGSAALAHRFDERNRAVITRIEHLITTAYSKRRHVGLCGRRSSDDPDFARFLVHTGIDSIAVAPASLLLAVEQNVAGAEEARRTRGDRAEPDAQAAGRIRRTPEQRPAGEPGSAKGDADGHTA